jgi:hypothetical protein
MIHLLFQGGICILADLLKIEELRQPLPLNWLAPPAGMPIAIVTAPSFIIIKAILTSP